MRVTHRDRQMVLSICTSELHLNKDRCGATQRDVAEKCLALSIRALSKEEYTNHHRHEPKSAETVTSHRQRGLGGMMHKVA